MTLAPERPPVPNVIDPLTGSEIRRPGDPVPYRPGSPEWERFQIEFAKVSEPDTLRRRYDGGPARESWCENPTPGYCRDGERWLARCKLYRCSHCGEIAASEWEETIHEILQLWTDAGLSIYFLTQTVRDHSEGSPWRFSLREAHREVTRRWSAMRKRLARQLGEEPHYVLAIERHSDGVIHWHALLASRIPIPNCSPRSLGGKNRWRKARGLEPLTLGSHWCDPAEPCVKAHAEELGLGFADMRPVKSLRAGARYLTKYVRKGVGDQFPRYARRIRCSRRELPSGAAPPGVGTIRSRRRDAYLSTLPDDRHTHSPDCEPRRCQPFGGGPYQPVVYFVVSGTRWPIDSVTEPVPAELVGRPPPETRARGPSEDSPLPDPRLPVPF